MLCYIHICVLVSLCNLFVLFSVSHGIYKEIWRIHIDIENWHIKSWLQSFIVLLLLCHMCWIYGNFLHVSEHSWVLFQQASYCTVSCMHPDSKDHGANMRPTWVLSAPGGPHIGPMSLVIMAAISRVHSRSHSQEASLISHSQVCCVCYLLWVSLWKNLSFENSTALYTLWWHPLLLYSCCRVMPVISE